MINEGFKKQLIVNAYKTQLLPVMEDKVKRNSIEANKRIKNVLLFKKDDNRLLDYIYKNEDYIDYDIFQFLNSLIYPIYFIYKYKYEYKYEYKKSDIQKIIQDIMKHNILRKKHYIDEHKNYAKYMEEVYD
jgi:hypothetical protein